MLISKKEISQWGTHWEGLRQFIDDPEQPELADVADLLGLERTFGDLVYIACRKMPMAPLVRFSSDCALTVIGILKPYLPGDDYDRIVDTLTNPNPDLFDVEFLIGSVAALRDSADCVWKTNHEARRLYGDDALDIYHSCCSVRTALCNVRDAAYGGRASDCDHAALMARKVADEKVRALLVDLFK
ncbi:hypothetical protein [Dickeya chrysanthemi]|uniref:hypothetical protein n=1 Tax=Dickeya chrysanthemi TaxID=556 RepID=UPI000532F917|nr:hypothetical protein [Dickeya chrysanthemi]